MEAMVNWSDLPPEMLEMIAVKVKRFDDFTAFRGVCTSWRAAAPKDTFKGAMLPLLMVSNFDYRDCKFYSLYNSKYCKAAVPEAEGKRCLNARFGWIVAVALSGGEVYLFKPFSSSPIIPLPNLPSFLNHSIKPVLSANPSETSDFMVFMLYNSHLGYCKNGDKDWTFIRHNCCDISCIGYCGHKLYAIDSDRHLYSWEPSATHLTQLPITLNSLFYFDMPYLIESNAGELLMIRRDPTPISGGFKVIRIDVEKRKCEVMNGGMGKDAIFCSGDNSVVSVASEYFSRVIKPNSIYFTEDGKGLEIFNFKDKSVQRTGLQMFRSVWVFPSLGELCY